MQLNRTLIMTLTAVVAALSALWFTTGAVTTKEATWDDVLAEAKNGGYRIIGGRDQRNTASFPSRISSAATLSEIRATPVPAATARLIASLLENSR
mgnify:CR=1 FL=1